MFMGIVLPLMDIGEEIAAVEMWGRSEGAEGH